MPRAGSATVLDRYVVHGEFASGGMATVCFGRALGAAGFSRTVAVKRLLPHLVKDPDFAAMFLDEARLAARVRHPHVVATLDAVAVDDGLLLVMEYVPGESLAALLRAGGRVPPGVAASLLIGVLGGLHAAHEARGEDGRPLEIVHRDVSPQNVLVGEDGLSRVLDFGIAHAAVRSQSTRDGRIKGKLRYMAPEQLHGARATRRADVYAAAVVLWEALTGERLFDGESDGAIYGRILEGVVRAPGTFAALPPALDDVVLRGLARDPAARFATAQEMAEALECAVAPATARQVAAWLQGVAGPVLAERARRVAAIEAGAIEAGAPRSAGEPTGRRRASEARSDDPASIAMVASTPATSTVTMPARPLFRPRRRLGAAAAAAGLAVVLAAALGARAAGRPARVTALRGIGPASLAVSSRLIWLAVTPDPTVTAAPISAPVVPAVRKAPSLRARRERSSCNPPYAVDATGIRRVKRECL